MEIPGGTVNVIEVVVAVSRVHFIPEIYTTLSVSTLLNPVPLSVSVFPDVATTGENDVIIGLGNTTE